MIQLENEVIEKLSSKGVLAYVAVLLADGTEASTAALAGLVRCQSGVMLEGLKELTVAVPERVVKAKNKWRCGMVKAGDGVVVQNLDSERYRLFVDDLKKYWDFLNPTLPFSIGAKDGVQIRMFLADHREWTQENWLQALRNRVVSVVKYGNASRSQPIWVWVGRLGDYAAGYLNGYNRPVEGVDGKTEQIRDRNREAVASAIAHS